MGDEELRRFPNRNILLIGVGTVFGTLGVILATLLAIPLAGALLGWSDSNPTTADAFFFLVVYGGVGSLIALAICAVMAFPMLLLWFPAFDFLRKKGLSLPFAAMATAGGLSFLGTVGICALAQWNGAANFPPPHWPFVMVPIGISVCLANYLSYDRSGAVWE